MKRYLLKAGKYLLVGILCVAIAEIWIAVRSHSIDESTLEEVRDWYGYEEIGDDKFISHKFTLNKVSESLVDINKDGRPDKWTVLIQPGEGYPRECLYSVTDLDADGVPDSLFIEVGTPNSGGHVYYNYRRIESGDFETSFMLDFSSSKDAYKYDDYNEDGRIDSIWERWKDSSETSEPEFAGYAIVKRQLLPIIEFSWKDGVACTAKNVDGTEVHLVFSDGDWREASSSDVRSDNSQGLQ